MSEANQESTNGRSAPNAPATPNPATPPALRAPDLAAILLAGSLLALLLAETAWRLLSHAPLYTAHPVVGYTLRPGSHSRYQAMDVDQEVVSNSHGLHDEEYPLRKPPGTRRVLVLGNSFQEALQVSVAQTFVKSLQGCLDDPRAAVRVQAVNASRGDRGCLDHHLVLRTMGWDFEPDLVLVSLGMTDPWHDWGSKDLIARDAQGNPTHVDSTGSGLLPQGLKAVLHRSWTLWHVMNAAKIFWTRVRSGKVFSPPPPALPDAAAPTARTSDETSIVRSDASPATRAMWDHTLGVLRRMNAECRQRGVPMMVMVIPMEDQLDAGAKTGERAQEILRAFGKQEGIPVLDLLPALRAATTRPLHFFEGHWNPAGHALAAAQACRFIREQRLLETSR